ncbi:MAG: glycosyl hydrolase [Candidatus Sulfotelmatobacter sp.]
MNPDVEVLQDPQLVPWPSFTMGSIRLWGTDTTWADLEPSPGQYTWTPLDNWLNLAQANGVTNIMYTFGKGTPPWISSDPTDTTCTKPGSTNPTLGWCDPPSDVNSGDTSFKNFVTAIVQHVAGQISAWECINEPDVAEQWTGTVAETLTMCTDMYNIVKANDSSALVVAPAPANGRDADGNCNGCTGKAVPWLTSYWQAGGAKVADVIAFHGYSSPETDPELVGTLAQNVVAAAASNGLGSYPVWDTEVGFNNDTEPGDITDPDQQVAFTAVIYLLQWSDGISRMYWYSYGNGATGTLTNTDGSLNEAGTAYGVVEGWMVGATLTSPCSASGTVWTCAFKNAKGTQVLAVWDAGQSCTGGTCTTSNYSPSATYTQYVDLTGATHTISASASNTAPIGIKPILLEP